MDSIIIQQKDLKKVVGLSGPTILKMERAGNFPRRRKLSLTRVGWLLEEVIQWAREREQVI
jgi:prophage regulatory protein